MSQIKQEYEEQTFNNSSDIDDAKDAGFGKLPVVNSGVNMKASPSLPSLLILLLPLPRNGSIYYKNPDKSSYYWDPRGFRVISIHRGDNISLEILCSTCNNLIDA
ncbi:hypothetical protein CVT25_012141 [Psilocybe cyanescens]|uniref:Uncharacterized protein n=1 Tax=Psilocybe cyanescens TaxID=93625 RepID=A0A409XJA7_PSICY|nr:hypothetical protein CVT25_012141 [Psilocybe cyanescens]